MRQLDGQAVVLAGGTGRVGGATLRALVARGARVLVVSRAQASALRAIDGFLEGAGRDAAFAFEADLGTPSGGEAVASEAVRRFGRIDAVVSLAGGGSKFVNVAKSTAADLAESVHNNLEVAYNLALPALRTMLAAKPAEGARSRGRFAFVTAGSSLDPQPRFGLMGIGKAGVNLLMLAIAREHKADGIVANAVVLGGVATEAARDYLDPDEFAASASPEEVADILAFHASDASSGVNGSLIHLNAREVD
jgi:NAD(P)-dependent dehydrogenase (short-subunit alcohol dehydrogenase family)